MADTFGVHAPSQMYAGAAPFPRYVNAMVLGGAGAESYTVPTGSKFCVITSALPFYGCVTGTAVVPTTEITDGTGSFYVASGMQCKLEGGTTLSVIRGTAASTIITIAHYE